MTADQAAQKILHTMERQYFVDWYEDIFVPDYIEEDKIPQDEMLKQIKHMFGLEE